MAPSITICRALTEHGYLPDLREEVARHRDEFKIGNLLEQDPAYLLSWASPVRPWRNGCIETGFFWQAAYIDQRGSYAESSLNTPEGIEAIQAFSAPLPARELLAANPSGSCSKYGQDAGGGAWRGVVLPLQIPTDRSVRAGGGGAVYHDFVKRACKRWGPELLLKVHPLLHEGYLPPLRELAEEHGCTLRRTNLSCLDGCRFVLTFCSGFGVDAMLRGVPVVQVAPGYWHRTGAVLYSAGDLPEEADLGTVAVGYRLTDFLAWRYCFCFKQPASQWIAMLRHYAQSEELFPMREEWSYARNLHHRDRRMIHRF